MATGEIRAILIESATSQFRKHVSESNYIGIKDLFKDPRVEAFIDINEINSIKRATLLHGAAQNNDLDMTRFCLNHGADSSIRDRKGNLPIDLTENNEIKNLLANSVVVTSFDNTWPPKLRGDLKVVRRVNVGNTNKFFPEGAESIDVRTSDVTPESLDLKKFTITTSEGSKKTYLAPDNSEARKWIIALSRSTYSKGVTNVNKINLEEVMGEMNRIIKHSLPALKRIPDFWNCISNELQIVKEFLIENVKQGELCTKKYSLEFAVNHLLEIRYHIHKFCQYVAFDDGKYDEKFETLKKKSLGIY
ncbi:15922_t:CDS:2 [Acaulospora morrowiae]|uniref:15922_t:CDS:1 n=1 Tax=Acaulospora morrowiae TaxID=94023 RepID=A0A9N8V7P6_9GLOM|nr:15922_t:CDS:2 [Acaulospora morrowiae]